MMSFMSFVFGDHRGPMTSKWFNSELKTRAKMAGVREPDQIHAHQLRYFAAVNWRLAGVQLDVISKLLGHQSLETTVRFYQEHPSEEMAEAISLSPLFSDHLSFELVRRKFKHLADFLTTTPFPLRVDLSGDLIIIEAMNKVK